MTFEEQKINLIAKINQLADRVDDRWLSLKIGQLAILGMLAIG